VAARIREIRGTSSVGWFVVFIFEPFKAVVCEHYPFLVDLDRNLNDAVLACREEIGVSHKMRRKNRPARGQLVVEARAALFPFLLNF